MHPHNNGMILITALIILGLMTSLILHIYQTIMTIEKVIAVDKFQLQKAETLRKKVIQMINRSYWPTICAKNNDHNSDGCVIEGYRYVIEAKYPSHCSVIYTGENWYNALFYHLWVWEENQETGYFIRFVKSEQKLTCRNPWKKLRTGIQSESVQPKRT